MGHKNALVKEYPDQARHSPVITEAPVDAAHQQAKDHGEEHAHACRCLQASVDSCQEVYCMQGLLDQR